MAANYGGYVSEEQVESKGSNLQFGLNSNCKFVKLVPVVGDPEKNISESMDFIFDVGGSELKKRIYPITKVKNMQTNQDITDPNDDLFKAAVSAQQGWFTSFFKVFMSEEKVKGAVEAAAKANNGILTFKQYVGSMYKAIPEAEYSKVSIDLFLEYGAEKDGKKYLELPSSRKNGKFITLHQVGNFTEVKDKDGLKYVNAENVQHPISRNKWWMDNVTGAKASSNTTPAMNAANAAIMSAPNAATFAAPSTGADDMDW